VDPCAPILCPGPSSSCTLLAHAIPCLRSSPPSQQNTISRAGHDPSSHRGCIHLLCRTIICVSEELCAVPNDNHEFQVCKALYSALIEVKWSKRSVYQSAVCSSKSTIGSGLREVINRNTQWPCVVVGTFLLWSVQDLHAPRKDDTEPKDFGSSLRDVGSSLDREPVPAAIRLHLVVRALTSISAGGKASCWP
jgi:hypothetical protein